MKRKLSKLIINVVCNFSVILPAPASRDGGPGSEAKNLLLRFFGLWPQNDGKNKKSHTTLIIILITMLYCFLIFQPAQALKTNAVLSVNTIQLDNGQIIRLAGLSPIEQSLTCENDIKFIEGLLKGRSIELETPSSHSNAVLVWFEIFPDSHLIAKNDMKLPRFYYTEKRPNGSGQEGVFVLLNATMIKAGYVKPSADFDHPTYSKLFNDLFKEAQQYTGSLCGGEHLD